MGKSRRTKAWKRRTSVGAAAGVPVATAVVGVPRGTLRASSMAAEDVVVVVHMIVVAVVVVVHMIVVAVVLVTWI